MGKDVALHEHGGLGWVDAGREVERGGLDCFLPEALGVVWGLFFCGWREEVGGGAGREWMVMV